MNKQITSIFVLSLFSLTFPIVLVCALFHGAIWGNFTFFYDEEKGRNAIEKLWLRPCERIISWGWEQRLTDRWTFQKTGVRISRGKPTHPSIEVYWKAD
jgi:hypothetical protein